MRRLCGATLLLAFGIALSLLSLGEGVQSVRVTILCDNYLRDASLTAEWGFSCLVAGLEKTILFDAGGSECSIHRNLEAAGTDLATMDAIAFSHTHSEHVAGLSCLFPLPSSVSIFVPSWFPNDWKRLVEAQSIEVVPVTGSTEICANAVLTGPILGAIAEEALCLRTPSGTVVITGCAHPGIVRMVEAVQALFPGETIALVLGGFHLLQESEACLRATAQRLQELGVVKVAPTHCSGDFARAAFRDVFGANYIEAGVGLVVMP